MTDIKIEPGKPIQGLNPNLAMFANESTTFSQVKSTAMESKNGEASMDTNLGNVTKEIDKGIEAKMSESDDADAQMQELKRLSNDLSQQANVAINTKAELTVATTIVQAATNARHPSRDESDLRNLMSPTPSNLLTGSFNRLYNEKPRVLFAIDASGSMWSPPCFLLGAANLLSSIANDLENSGVSMDYVFWDDRCDIPRPFDVAAAQALANGEPHVSAEDGKGYLKTSVGGGGTNIFCVANRLTPYVYPPAPGMSDQDRELKQGLDDNVIAEMDLKFGYDYDFIIFYSDFVFDNRNSPTGDLEEDQRRFDQITVSPGNMCCVCCSQQGESRINKNFKENVTWISYEEWQKDINIEMSHPLVKY